MTSHRSLPVLVALPLLTVALLVALLVPAGARAAEEPQTTRASLAADGSQATGASGPVAVSAEGRYVVFVTRASLVSEDTGLSPNYSPPLPTMDVYRRDTRTGVTVLVSRMSGAAGAPGAADSSGGSISADGRYVAFNSKAALVPEDTNGADDVYVRDLEASTTVLVSRGGGAAGAIGNNPSRIWGAGGDAISADGRRVVFTSSATNFYLGDVNTDDVFVRDLDAETTTLVSRADGADGARLYSNSNGASISADGRVVAFASGADGFTAGDTNGYGDVFVRTLATGRTERVSVASSGAQGNATSGQDDYYSSFAATALSADGQRVAFFSAASNLVPGDTNNRGDVFVRDRGAGTTQLVTRASGADGAIASGGRAQAQVLDISHDGRYVAFASLASNLAPGGDGNGRFDVFVRDTSGDLTQLISRASGRTGAPAAQTSDTPLISDDGRFAAFRSDDSYLVSSDSNGVADTFVRGPLPVPVVTGDATANSTSASVGALVEASLVPGYSDGASTQLYIEYGEDQGADTTYSRSSETDASGPPMSALISLSGLRPETRYRYRAVATNSGGGRAAGVERIFTTQAAAPEPTPQPNPTPEPQPDPQPNPDPEPQPAMDPGTISDRECRAPTVSQVSGAATPGERVELTGSGLGRSGEVRVAGVVAQTPEWMPWRVVAVVPEAVAPGEAGVAVRCGRDTDYRIVELRVQVERRLNLAPTANVVVTRPGHDRDRTRFLLDGRSSVDPEGKPLTYEWRALGRKGTAGRVLSRRSHFILRSRSRQRVMLTVRDPEGAKGWRVVTVVPGQRKQVTRLTLPAAGFAFDRAALGASDRRALQRLRRLVRGADRLVLTGRTDHIGSRAYNRRLCARRAEAVRRFLLAGVSEHERPRRVLVRAFGENHPLPGISQRTARGRALNRTVQVLIVHTGR